ncbi:ankyrin repeat-containing domain protein [Xylogone sp. PMI_703]|nr:ankyrin repeat-containing domain protein [Xylogone sp. PMI_703]
MAATRGSSALVQLLLDKGADINFSSDVYRGGRIAKMGCPSTALVEAARYGYVEIIRQLLDAGADIEKQQVEWGTSLWTAVHYRHEDAVRLLLEHGANPATVVTNRLPCLCMAASMGCERIATLLLDHGVDIEREAVPKISLVFAIYGHHVNMVRLLLQRGAKIRPGWNLLSIAVLKGARSEAMVRVLLEYGADANEPGLRGKTALHDAAGNGIESTVRVLVEEGHMYVNVRDSVGRTPLHQAIFRCLERFRQVKDAALYARIEDCYKATMRYLLQKGAYVDAKNLCNTTVLHHIAFSEQIGLASFLMEHGIDTEAKMDSEGSQMTTHYGTDSNSEFLIKKQKRSVWTPHDIVLAKHREEIIRVLGEKATGVHREMGKQRRRRYAPSESDVLDEFSDELERLFI